MTDAVSAKAGAARTAQRGLVTALFVSLAVNLIVGGSLIGAIWRAYAPPPGGPFIIPNLLGYASTLPPERRKELWDRTAEERAHVRPFRREVRAARQETVKALIAEPFDREKFVAIQAKQVEIENRARSAAQQLYVKIADHLTPEERHGYPRWREHRRPPSHNLLDEPDRQAGGESKQAVK
jgi:uncharacterized membrane protein